uniref:Reverse transcriptase domain-containing protein n=1 Tax=Oryzias latipes TaxID=8090 RepID=A0A3B3I2G4_ORYLA
GGKKNNILQKRKNITTPKGSVKQFSMEELKYALKSTASGKAPGLDGMSSEILKYGGEKLCESLLDLFNRCLISGTVPQDFRDSLIVTIYKKKGDRADSGKVLAKIVLNRLKTNAEEVLPESQCGLD